MADSRSPRSQGPTRSEGKQTTKVFIQRDYTRGTACRFQTKFPTELENKIDRNLFEETVNKINSIYDDAEHVGPRSYCENIVGCLTAYLSLLCITTQYSKCLRRLEQYIADQNQNVFVPRGLMITNPMDRGLRVIEITILNPGSTER